MYIPISVLLLVLIFFVPGFIDFVAAMIIAPFSILGDVLRSRRRTRSQAEQAESAEFWSAIGALPLAYGIVTGGIILLLILASFTKTPHGY